MSFNDALSRIKSDGTVGMRRPSWSAGLTIKFNAADQWLNWCQDGYEAFGLVTLSAAGILANDWEVVPV